MKQAWYGLLYYLSWGVFGAAALLVNLACIPLLLLPASWRPTRFIRQLIQGIFRGWVTWLNGLGVVRVHWRGGTRRELPRAALYVANHPTLVDATVVLGCIPAAVCIFKPRLLRNPLIGPAVRVAHYVPGDAGVDTVRAAAAALASGQSVLVFPEGTRTDRGRPLNPLKPGFALIARLAAADVQILRINASHSLAPRGKPWWHLPPLPGWICVTVDETLSTNESTATETLVSQVEARLQTAWTGNLADS